MRSVTNGEAEAAERRGLARMTDCDVQRGARALLEHVAQVPTPLCLHLGDAGTVDHDVIAEVFALAREGLAARVRRAQSRRLGVPSERLR